MRRASFRSGLRGRWAEPDSADARCAAVIGGANQTHVPLADRVLKSLERKGWIAVEQVAHERDPLRAPAARLRVALNGNGGDGACPKLPKAERELLAYLALHPGSHNLGEIEPIVRSASVAARALARKKLRDARAGAARNHAPPPHPPYQLNAAQRSAFDLIKAGIEARRFRVSAHGVTGSGKTEVYLKAIEASLASGRGALLWFPRSR